MINLEKHTFKQINKDVSPFSVDNGGNREYLPSHLIDALNVRYLSSEDGEAGKVTNLKGNVLIDYSNYPTGTTKMVGAFLYNKLNGIIYLLYNAEGQHQIVLYKKNEKTFTTLVENPLLFSDEPQQYINQGGIEDDIFIWNDKIDSIKSVSVKLCMSGFYNSVQDKRLFELFKGTPIYPPTIIPGTDENLSFNKLCDNSYKFFYRYVFKDNMVSVFSPYSKLMRAYFFSDPTNSYRNVVGISVIIDSYLLPIIKSIEFGFVKNSDSEHVIFHNEKNPTSTNINIEYNGYSKETVVSDEEVIRYFNDIPNRTEAIELMDNRLICVSNETGFNVDESTFSLSLQKEKDEWSLENDKKYFKDGGIYNIGVVFGDNNGKRTFVKGVKKIELPFYPSFTKFSFLGEGIIPEEIGRGDDDFDLVSWSLQGLPPANMDWYSIVISENLKQSDFFECIAIPHQLSGLTPEGEDEAKETSYIWKGREFIRLDVDPNPPNPLSTRSIYMQVPLNIPFTPENGDILYIKNFNWPYKREHIIVDFTENFVVIGLIYQNEEDIIDDWRDYMPIFIEIYKQAKNSDLFYEVGEIYPIIEGEFSVTEGILEGDNYVYQDREYRNSDLFNLKDRHYFYQWELAPYTAFPETINTWNAYVYEKILTRSPTTKSYNNESSFAGDFRLRNDSPVKYKIDIDKVASNFGRVYTEDDDEEIKNLFGTLSYSFPYFQDTQINGLGSFSAANKYAIPVERSPIRGLLRVNDILLAVHENETSSVYVGESFIRQGNDFVLVQTQNFIGDDRELEYSYGTVNPESLLKVYGMAFWWDNIKGAVIRYTKAGLFPISNYGVRTHFYKKSKLYSPYIGQIKILSGFDYFHDEYIITFPEIKGSGNEILVQGETWAFNIKDEKWTSRYSFMPEGYAAINNDFYTFKNGQLWHQNQNPIHNNFFNIQYSRELRFYSNPLPGRIKTWLNIHVNSDYIYSGGNEEYKVVEIRGIDKKSQESFIPAYEFEDDEGKFYAPILRDINTPPNELPDGTIALRDGDSIFGEVIEILIRSDRTDEHILKHINTVFKLENYSK